MCQQSFYVCPTCGTMTQGTTEPCSNPSSISCPNTLKQMVLPLPSDHECERCLRRLQGHRDCGPGGKFPRGCWGDFWKALASPAKASNVDLRTPQLAENTNSKDTVSEHTADDVAPLSPKISSKTKSGCTPATSRLSSHDDTRVAFLLGPIEKRRLRPRKQSGQEGKSRGRSTVLRPRSKIIRKLGFHAERQRNSNKRCKRA